MISLLIWAGGKDTHSDYNKHHCPLFKPFSVPVLKTDVALGIVQAMVCEGDNNSTHLCLCLRLRKDEDLLSISAVNEGDEGIYMCTVKSEIDADSASARLTVLGTLPWSADQSFQMQLCFYNCVFCAFTLKYSMYSKTLT